MNTRSQESDQRLPPIPCSTPCSTTNIASPETSRWYHHWLRKSWSARSKRHRRDSERQTHLRDCQDQNGRRQGRRRGADVQGHCGKCEVDGNSNRKVRSVRQAYKIMYYILARSFISSDDISPRDEPRIETCSIAVTLSRSRSVGRPFPTRRPPSRPGES